MSNQKYILVSERTFNECLSKQTWSFRVFNYHETYFIEFKIEKLSLFPFQFYRLDVVDAVNVGNC